MSYVGPEKVAVSMLESGLAKTKLSAAQMVLRGAVSTFLLGAAVLLAVTAAGQSGVDVFGALLFPMGLVMVILLGLELLTGNMALVPLAVIEKRASFGHMVGSFGWVLFGHILGGLLAALLIAALLTEWWTAQADEFGLAIADMAAEKTIGYQHLGYLGGAGLALLNGILCNGLVCLGVVMGMTSTDTTGKILAIWFPIAAFYALGFEHSVVNLFVIPAGMMLGAPVGIDDWWLWNQIPVLVGNLIGALALTGLPLHYAFRQRTASASD
ncbi:formate/nitrite transporter family protein [Citricoccus nitrophenolicus]|uniref:Formate/nitrite transporter n=1 Tax=Citricoccus muralis TaxID=169134 RepID=A0A3D9LFE7_9MICC|nr:formate/nitrite transporter family protein [Citricoccus muralis]REE05159.1 formate/nitrite transporter [Citricoccus muralis]